MHISEHKVVLFHFTLKGDDGEVIDSSFDDEPVTYLHGAGEVVPGLETAFEGKSAGDRFQVVVQPSEGFGQRDESRCEVVPKEEFEEVEDLEVGMQFHVPTDDGESVVTVVEIGDETVSLDGNHDLAGLVLHFDVTVQEVREATPDEIAHGHAHGNGCSHDHDH
jgi:FKBP-type peptidyl-prolyl cis-trans isomerase SlyD